MNNINRNSYDQNFTVGGKLISLIFMVVGIGVFIFGLNFVKQYDEKKETYNTVEATIVDEVYDSESSTTAPVYEYEVDGKIYTYKSNTYSSGRKNIGSKETIYYNPDRPNDAFNDMNIKIFGFFEVFGVIFAVAGFVVFISNIKLINKRLKNLIMSIFVGIIFILLPFLFMSFIDNLPIFIKVFLFLFVAVGGYSILKALYIFFINPNYVPKRQNSYNNNMIYNDGNYNINSNIALQNIQNSKKFKTIKKISNLVTILIILYIIISFVISIISN